MQTILIGTTPKIIFNANIKRVRWTLQFQPVQVNAADTGKVFIGRGFIPNATVGDPNQGEVLVAGASIEEKKQFPEDTLPYKGVIWAVADTENQMIIVDETAEEAAPVTQ